MITRVPSEQQFRASGVSSANAHHFTSRRGCGKLRWGGGQLHHKLHDHTLRGPDPRAVGSGRLTQEKLSRGQMASDPIFQAGAEQACPICAGKVAASLTDLKSS